MRLQCVLAFGVLAFFTARGRCQPHAPTHIAKINPESNFVSNNDLEMDNGLSISGPLRKVKAFQKLSMVHPNDIMSSSNAMMAPTKIGRKNIKLFNKNI